MVLSYTCIRKCFFNEGIRNPGDRLVLEQSVGDANPHFMRSEEDHQLIQMQVSNNEALLADSKTAGKAVSAKKKQQATKKKPNGGKTK